MADTLDRIFNVSEEGLAKLFKDHVGSDAEQRRRREAARRLDLYRDRGRLHFERAIDAIWKNPEVRAWRKDFLQFAEFQNVTRRITREISTVYSEPAKRKVGKGQKNFDELAKLLRYDRSMRQVNRLGNLLNNVLVWPGLILVNGESLPVQRLATPDKFSAIAYPEDQTRAACFIVDQMQPKAASHEVHYIVLSAAEYLWLDKGCRIIRREPNDLAEMPALLWSKDELEEGILDGTSGADIPSAHLAIALLNTMMLKHQKSGTRVPYATGDTSGMARGQAMDEESVIEVPEGVLLNTLDMGANPDAYITAVRSVIKQVAANHGIPESVFDLSYQATSGFEIELKRTGLRELRNEQILDFRPFEARLAELWEKVLVGHPLAFTAGKFKVNFGNVDTPQSPDQKIVYWKEMEMLGLKNRLEMLMEIEPELTEQEARERLDENMNIRIEIMRAFQVENQGTFTPGDGTNQPNQPPEDNEE